MKRVPHVTPNHLLKSLFERGWFSRIRRQASDHQPWRVGICVSGGPDSMALAYLLRHMPHPYAEGIRAFSPYALVVDHDVREGSHQEAVWVKNHLEMMGIDTYVRKLDWDPDMDPKSMRGFEMKARDKRYRALVRLATANQLQDLFTGHHRDDQVETMMLRLLRDKHLNPLSFRGMSMTSTVPTADESQESSTSSHSCSNVALFSHQYYDAAPARAERYRLGMQLHRPLLEYQKAQLIATCEHFNIPYVHDKTNFNPKLTPRNAIRYIRTRCKLPKALRSENLLDLCAKANQIYSTAEEQARLFILNHVQDFFMHSESGLLCLRLKVLPCTMTEAQTRGFAFFMQRAISIVSPLKDESLPSVMNQDYVQQFHALCTPRPVSVSTKPTSLVYNQVVCARLSGDSSGSPWIQFARQPLSPAGSHALTQGFEPHEASSADGSGQFDSRWILWDQRFWIRIQICGNKIAMTEVTIRPYIQSDVRAIKTILKERGELEVFEKPLSLYAPGWIRFTLPVVLVSGKIVAFPTLNISVASNIPLTWQVLYSRSRRAADFFFPDMKDGGMVLWSTGTRGGPCLPIKYCEELRLCH